jgi:hypothetical protein
MRVGQKVIDKDMRELWKTKERLSLHYLSLTPEEWKREEQEAMDRFANLTGRPPRMRDKPFGAEMEA